MYCLDILDASMALIESATSGKTVEFITCNSEQFNNIYMVINDIFDNFTYYYYAYGDNYKEHPSYGKVFDECEAIENTELLIDRKEIYSDNNNSMYKALLSSNEDSVTSNIIFEVIYKKVSDTAIKVLFTITDKNKCHQALQAYFSASNYEWFQSEYGNILSKEGQAKQLYELLTEKDYNLSYFYVDDLKYIKAICEYEYQNKLFIYGTKVYFNKDNKLTCRCIIADEGFVFEYGSEHDNKNTIIETQTPVMEVKSTNKKIAKLTDIEKQIISARAYLEEHSGKLRVTYKDIANFLTDNGIYRITENNIKQKVSNIYTTLDIQDLGNAVVMLRDANALIKYENVEI